MLSLIDFGLLSSLTYEDKLENIKHALHLYLPGWYVERNWKATRSQRDWTSFLQFTSGFMLLL